MLNILESLENLGVSEECFDSIMDIVEDIIDAASKKVEQAESNLQGLIKDKSPESWLKKSGDNYTQAQELLSKAKKVKKASEDNLKKRGINPLSNSERGIEKNKDIQKKKREAMTVQAQKILSQVPLKSSEEKSKERHFKKELKHSMDSLKF